MTIRRIQTCDGCGDDRRLEERDDPDLAGWREIRADKHLCSGCIQRALSGLLKPGRRCTCGMTDASSRRACPVHGEGAPADG